MKNKNLTISLVMGTVILLGVGAFVLISGKNTDTAAVAQNSPEETISMLKPEEIGLVLTASSDSRKVILRVDNTEDIQGLDYELSYTSKGDVPRGIIGHISIKQPGQKVSQEITLGTCSDVCHYDEDVSDISLVLKVAKTDGTTAQVEKSLELE